MLRIILVFTVIYLVVRLIQSFAGNSAQQTGRNRNQNFNRKEGDTAVDTSKARKSKKISKTEGEYIDYEEL
jgi:hypothetical protein